MQPGHLRTRRLFLMFALRAPALCAPAQGAGAPFEAALQAFRRCPRPCCLLLSIKAAGSGLTLNEASEVIVVDPLEDGAQLDQVEEGARPLDSKALWRPPPIPTLNRPCTGFQCRVPPLWHPWPGGLWPSQQSRAAGCIPRVKMGAD